MKAGASDGRMADKASLDSGVFASICLLSLAKFICVSLALGVDRSRWRGTCLPCVPFLKVESAGEGQVPCS